MHRILIEIGPVTIYSYGFFLAVAFLICIFLIRRDAERFGLAFDKILDCLIWILISGIVGGRLLYVLINWQYYVQYPLRILALRDGGMAFHGSLVLAVVAGVFISRFKGLPFWRTSDFLAPYIPLGHAIGRIGCFFNGCCYGKVIEDGPGVTFPGELHMRIPVQLYSSLFLLLLYFLLSFLRGKKFFDGFIFCAYVIIYSIFRFFIEFFRGDTPPVLFGMTLPQIISAGMFMLGMAVWLILYLRTKKLGKTVLDEGA